MGIRLSHWLGCDFSVAEQWVWSRDHGDGRPHEVAESQPNAWGLYDMHGNAMEWCRDAWGEYPEGTADVTVDPFKIGQPDTETTFVVRGGAWWLGPGRMYEPLAFPELQQSQWLSGLPNRVGTRNTTPATQELDPFKAR